MRIFIAGLETETNTFSPFPTLLEDYHITRAEDLDEQMEPLASMPPFAQWLDRAKADKAECIFSIYGWAQPAGPTEKKAYEYFRDRILLDLKEAGEIDIVLLFLHGAMIAEDYEDCEADLMALIRHQVGSATVIAAELDLHAQLSPAMVDVADLLIAYKEYPHIDVAVRGEELYDLAVKAWRGAIKPTMALVDCNMTGLFPTTNSPLREFVDSMTKMEQVPAVLSVSFIHSFTYGDVAIAGSKMLVVTDADTDLAIAVATELSDQLYAMREAITVVSVSLDEALKQACASIVATKNDKPVVIADQSDNAGGGAPADSTFALHWLLEHNIKHVAIAIFYDSDIVQQAMNAGEGVTFRAGLGGHYGQVSGEPVITDYTVIKVARDYQHQFPQIDSAPLMMPLGDTVSLRCHGVELVVSSIRCQCFCPSIFTDLNISAGEKDLLIVKSSQHFYNAFKPIANRIIYMSAPGAVPPDVRKIEYKAMQTDSKFPWVQDPRSSRELVFYAKESLQ